MSIKFHVLLNTKTQSKYYAKAQSKGDVRKALRTKTFSKDDMQQRL